MPDFKKLLVCQQYKLLNTLARRKGNGANSVLSPVLKTGKRSDGIEPVEKLFREIDKDENSIIIFHTENPTNE